MSVRWEIAKKEMKTHFRRKNTVLGTVTILALFSAMTILPMWRRLGGVTPITYSQINTLLDSGLSYAIICPVIACAGMALLAFPREKEAKTLQHLLVMPIKERDLFLGKVGAAVVSGLVSGVIVFAIVLIAVSLMFPGAIADVFYPGPAIWLIIFAIAPLFIALSSLLVISLTLYFTSTRESYVAYFVVLGILVGLFILKGELSMDPLITNVVIAALLLVATIATYFIGIKSLNRERLVTRI